MNLSKREVILIAVLLITLLCVGYYLFYFQPTSIKIKEIQLSIAQKTEDIEAAHMRITQWSALMARKNQLLNEWSELLEELPYGFDDSEFLVNVQNIIIPYTSDVYIILPTQERVQQATAIYSATLEFSVTYKALQAILNSFKEADLYSRINNIFYTNLQSENSEAILGIRMEVDMLRRPNKMASE